MILLHFARNARLENIRSRLLEARDRSDNPDDLQAGKHELSSEVSEILQAFDDAVIAFQVEAKMVGRPLAVVQQESPERARIEAENAHEDAFLVACRLWDASAVEGVRNRPKPIDDTGRDLNTMQDLEVPPTPVLDIERGKSIGAASEVGQKNVATVSAGELITRQAGTEQPRAIENGAARDAESGVQQARVTQVDGGTSDSSAPSTDSAPPDAQAEETLTMPTTSGTATDIARNPVAKTENAEKTIDVDHSSSSPEVVDVSVVCDATVMSSVATSRSGQSVREGGGMERSRAGPLPEEAMETESRGSSIEVVVDKSSSYVDVEVEVEDDVSEPTRIGLKFLDVSALLIEKVLFVGLPTLVSGGSLVWERVDNALNGAKGRKGWKLLRRLKKDSSGSDDTVL